VEPKKKKKKKNFFAKKTCYNKNKKYLQTHKFDKLLLLKMCFHFDFVFFFCCYERELSKNLNFFYLLSRKLIAFAWDHKKWINVLYENFSI
jgi:hypothetical protein